MKSSFYGCLRNTQNNSRLFDAQLLKVPKDQYLAISGAESTDGILQCLLYFVLFQQFGRYRAPVGVIPRSILSLFALILVVDRVVEVRTRLSQFHSGLVVSNLHQPRAEFCFPTETSDVGECLENGLLCHFLRVSWVFHN